MREDLQPYQVNVDHVIPVMSSRSCDPGTEAHGGYTFCGFAALVLLGKPHLCDVNKLLVSNLIMFLPQCVSGSKVISSWITSYSPCEQGSYPLYSRKFPLYRYLSYLLSASSRTPESCLYWDI